MSSRLRAWEQTRRRPGNSTLGERAREIKFSSPEIENQRNPVCGRDKTLKLLISDELLAVTKDGIYIYAIDVTSPTILEA